MILTDREIRLSVAQGLIEIDPEPGAAAYSSTSVDLTLDASVQCFKPNVSGVDLRIDPGAAGYSFASAINHVSTVVEIGNDGFDLSPGVLILAWTRERVHLRSMARIAARVEGKSSLARLGLAVHITAPTIHAGFAGPIQLEMVNHGPVPIRLRAGMRICQLIFEQTLGFPDHGYSGQFKGQGRR